LTWPTPRPRGPLLRALSHQYSRTCASQEAWSGRRSSHLLEPGGDDVKLAHVAGLVMGSQGRREAEVRRAQARDAVRAVIISQLARAPTPSRPPNRTCWSRRRCWCHRCSWPASNRSRRCEGHRRRRRQGPRALDGLSGARAEAVQCRPTDRRICQTRQPVPRVVW
jgi:hypothetical protein